MELINELKVFRHKAYIWKFCHRKIQNNKIVMWANSFKHFGDSPKYIALHLLNHYPGKFDIVWVIAQDYDIPKDIPKQIRVVRYFSIEYLQELHTAKFIVCNMRTGDSYFWNKRPEQIYIQTWHSSLRLKKIEGDAAAALGEDYVAAAKKDSERIDLLISGCEFSTEIFKRSFWYTGKILKSGTPRCDILINDSECVRQKVFDYYKISSHKKLLLYAPTFRDDKKADLFGMDFVKLSNALKKTGDDWEIAYRFHPNIMESVDINGCISMSKYSDMQELICAADILITDYSSCMFDMAMAKKFCVLYTPDLEEYKSKERGLYFDIQQLPFPLAQNMEELCYKVINYDMNLYNKKINKFLRYTGSYEDGHASERIAKYITGKM